MDFQSVKDECFVENQTDTYTVDRAKVVALFQDVMSVRAQQGGWRLAPTKAEVEQLGNSSPPVNFSRRISTDEYRFAWPAGHARPSHQGRLRLNLRPRRCRCRGTNQHLKRRVRGRRRLMEPSGAIRLPMQIADLPNFSRSFNSWRTGFARPNPPPISWSGREPACRRLPSHCRPKSSQSCSYRS